MKKFLLFALFLVFVIASQAQTTAYFRVAKHGYLRKIQPVSSGGYITAGNDSNYKIQVVRWDANFNPVWKYTITDANVGPFTPYIVEANDGNFYLMTSSTVNTGSTCIFKFSSTGSLLWNKLYSVSGGALTSFALSKALPGDNGFLFGGGQCALTNDVIKCDASGNIEWQKQYYYPPASGVITCWSIIPDGNKYAICAGYNTNSLLVFTTDATGNVLSQSAYTYATHQIIPTRMVKLDQSGGYAVVGNYNNSNDNKTEFVAIYSSTLALNSFNELTVTYTQFELYDIAATDNGQNVVVDGSIYDDSKFSIATIKLSAGGNIVWKKRANGNTGSITNVEFYGLAPLGNGTIHCGAGYNDGSIFGILDANGSGLCNEETFNMTNVHPSLAVQTATIIPMAATVTASVVSYTYNNNFVSSPYVYCGSISGTDEPETESADNLQVIPNPADDHIFVEGMGNEVLNVSIYDLSGRMVVPGQTYVSGNAVLIDDLPAGYYFVEVTVKSSGERSILPMIKR